MNKNATLMSHLQNAAIAVLTVTAVLLLIQTPLVGDLAGKTPYELAQDWLAGDTSTDTAVTTDLTELALPVRVVFTNEYARYGLSAITTLDTDFELAGTFFGEALGSATTYEACSGEKLLTALHASSIYLDLEAPTPLEVLSRILGVNDAPESSLLRVTRLVLCPAENGATLYLQDANQGFFVSRTEISSATLREALASLDGNGTDFAFSLSGEFSQLSPYTLIFSEPPQRYTLSASNSLTDQAAFLRLAEFNPHTESGYTDSSGSTIIKEVYGTLRLEPDGSVFYQGADEAEAGSLYYVSAASTEKPTMLEAVAGAQRLAFTLLRDVSGDAELYLSEIDSSTDSTGNSISATSGTGLSTAQVAELVSPSVVVITTEQVVYSQWSWYGQSQVESGAGSGVIISSDGYILTCAHVVSGASNITVSIGDKDYPATLVGEDTTSDIAVVKVDATGLTPATVGDSDNLKVGESVMAVGNPLGELGGTVTSGIVSALNRSVSIQGSSSVNTMSLIQMDASVSPGNSGGGLFNMNGELVGIVNAKSSDSDAEGLGFAIPVNDAVKVAQELLENGYVTGRPYLGISYYAVTDAQTAAQLGVNAYGVYIVEVVKGGPADKAGLQAGDRIVSVDGSEVATQSDLGTLMQDHKAGDTIEITVARGGQMQTVSVTLGEKGAENN